MQEKSNTFIKLYIKHLATVSGVKNHEFLYELFKLVNFFGELHLNAYLKEMIAKKLDLTINRIDHLLGEFKKKDLLKSIGTKRGSGSYMLNPKIFFKGSEHAQRKCLYVYNNITSIIRSTTYNADGVTETSTIEVTDPETGEIIILKNEEIFGDEANK